VRRGLAKDCLLVSGGCCAAEGPGDSPGTTSNRVTVYCWGRRAIIAGRCIGTARAADPLDRKRLQGLRSPGVRRPSRIRSTTSGRAPAETASARAQETGRRGEPRDPTCPSRRPVPRRRAPRTETTNNVHIGLLWADLGLLDDDRSGALLCLGRLLLTARGHLVARRPARSGPVPRSWHGAISRYSNCSACAPGHAPLTTPVRSGQVAGYPTAEAGGRTPCTGVRQARCNQRRSRPQIMSPVANATATLTNGRSSILPAMLRACCRPDANKSLPSRAPCSPLSAAKL
jgi:hypothetical protein